MLDDPPQDVATAILERFDDPTDLIRFSAVSHAWKGLVTRNGFVKKLFLKKAAIADTACVDFEDDKENAACGLLIRAMQCVNPRDLSIEALKASSTLSPEFSIQNTLSSLVESRQWSSQGQEAVTGMERLIYTLPQLCMAYSFVIRPFRDESLMGSPTFRARSARFSFGSYHNDTGGFVETYSTETYHIPSSGLLEVRLQKSLLCIHKQMMIELSGFVDKHPSQAQYYMRVSSVHVVGISLADTFKTAISPSSGQWMLEAISYLDPKIKRDLRVLERNHLTVDGADDVDISHLASLLNPKCSMT